MKIGEALLFIRKRSGWSQRYMAEIIGASHVHICNMEKGHAEPSLTMLARYTDVTGVDPYVLAWSAPENMPKINPRMRSAAKSVRAAMEKCL